MTVIPSHYFYLFATGIYHRLVYFLNDTNKQREIIQNNKKGWKTFIHLIYWGMPAPHRINDGKNRPHGYAQNGKIWKYDEYHVEHILSIFKKLDIITFYYFGRETNMPRVNLNAYVKNGDENKVSPYDKIYILRQITDNELQIELQQYTQTHNININPKGLFV